MTLQKARISQRQQLYEQEIEIAVICKNVGIDITPEQIETQVLLQIYPPISVEEIKLWQQKQ